MSPLQEAIDAVLSYQWHGPREQLAALERLVTEARRVCDAETSAEGLTRWALCPETDTPCSTCPTLRTPCEAAPQPAEQQRAAFYAWVSTQDGHPFAGRYTTLMRKAWMAAIEHAERLGIAAPPAPQSGGRALTDEQLREIARNCGSSVANTLRSWWPECKEFARAIERAHGIKSEGE